MLICVFMFIILDSSEDYKKPALTRTVFYGKIERSKAQLRRRKQGVSIRPTFDRFPILKTGDEMVHRYFGHGVGRAAAGLAYYFLLAVFPMLIFINTVIGMLHLDVMRIAQELEFVVPDQVLAIITDYIEYISRLSPSLLLYAGGVLAVWALSRCFSSLLKALSLAYRTESRPGFLGVFVSAVMSIVLMVSIIVLVAVLMISQTLFNVIASRLHMPAVLVSLWDLLRITVLPLYAFLVLSCFYHVASRGRYPFSRAFPGALFFCVTWLAMSMGLSYYINNMTRYSLLYGSLGAVMLMLLWLYLTAVMLILGGELNHTLIVHKNIRSHGAKGEKKCQTSSECPSPSQPPSEPKR